VYRIGFSRSRVEVTGYSFGSNIFLVDRTGVGFEYCVSVLTIKQVRLERRSNFRDYAVTFSLLVLGLCTYHRGVVLTKKILI